MGRNGKEKEKGKRRGKRWKGYNRVEGRDASNVGDRVLVGRVHWHEEPHAGYEEKGDYGHPDVMPWQIHHELLEFARGSQGAPLVPPHVESEVPAVVVEEEPILVFCVIRLLLSFPFGPEEMARLPAEARGGIRVTLWVEWHHVISIIINVM